MRVGAFFISLFLLLAACGTGPDSGTTQLEPPSSVVTTTTTQPTTTTSTAPSTTSSTTTPPDVWSVAAVGMNPVEPFTTSNAAGSGCSPGSDDLPDGVWFGWVTEWSRQSVSFDLACLWPGRLDPAVSNESARIRTVPLAAGVKVWTATGATSYTEFEPDGTTSNAPGLPDGAASWLYVNGGRVTEIAEYSDPIAWARSTGAWPAGLSPGCCDAGTLAPASPSAPWPTEGWPADGFYAMAIAEEEWLMPAKGPMHLGPMTEAEVSIWQWVSCGDRPDLCPEWWTEDMVTVETPEWPLERQLRFDSDLTVVLEPIGDEEPIVGDGEALTALLGPYDAAIQQWIVEAEPTADEYRDWARDPDFPFGIYLFSPEEEIGPIGYRGPGGVLLTEGWWWLALEIRDGQPILYIHAGLVAG